MAISKLKIDDLCIALAASVTYLRFKIGVRIVILLLKGWSEQPIGQGNPDDL